MIDAETKNRIDEYIDERRDEIISDITQLVAIQSVTGQVEENIRALEFVSARARCFGFTTSMTNERDVAVIDFDSDHLYGEGATAGEREKSEFPILGILVHVDVVDVGDLLKWTSDPFDLTIRGGYMHGRGTADDKGPVILSLYAMRAVRDLCGSWPINRNVHSRPRVRLIVGTSEESVWMDMKHYRAQYEAPDFGFSPDGEFPVFNEENGYTDVLLTFPAPDEIEHLKAGESPNTIPSLAEIKLKGHEAVTFHGKSAHSSAPETGNNAILKLCAAYSGGPFGFCDFVTGNKAIAGIPFAPTILRKTGSTVELNVNIRQTPGVSREMIESAFTTAKDDYGFTYEIIDYLEPMYTDPSQPFLKTMLEVYHAYGLTGGFERARGTSYAKSMANFVSWGPLMQGDPDTAHMENERLSLETAFTSAKLYASYIASLWF